MSVSYVWLSGLSRQADRREPTGGEKGRRSASAKEPCPISRNWRLDSECEFITAPLLKLTSAMYLYHARCIVFLLRCCLFFQLYSARLPSPGWAKTNAYAWY